MASDLLTFRRNNIVNARVLVKELVLWNSPTTLLRLITSGDAELPLLVSGSALASVASVQEERSYQFHIPGTTIRANQESHRNIDVSPQRRHI